MRTSSHPGCEGIWTGLSRGSKDRLTHWVSSGHPVGVTRPTGNRCVIPVVRSYVTDVTPQVVLGCSTLRLVVLGFTTLGFYSFTVFT